MTKVDRYDWDALPDGVPIRMVPLAKMAVDNTYQRDRLSEVNIMAIARHWSHAACGALVANLREDGLYYILDGNHRRLAAERRGDIVALPCRVCQGLTVPEEAALFRALNMVRTKVDAYCRYRSALVQGDALTVELNNVLTGMGLAVRQGDEPHCLAFPVALFRAFRNGARETVDALAIGRTMIGPAQNITKEIFIGTWYVLRRAAAERVREYAGNVYDRGGRKLLLNSIHEATIELGKTRAHERICGIGVARVLNYRRKAPIALTDGEKA